MSTTEKTQAIMADFQRKVKGAPHTTDAYSLPELEFADADLGALDLNAGFRTALKAKIGELKATQEGNKAAVRESHGRAIAAVVGLALAVLGWLLTK